MLSEEKVAPCFVRQNISWSSNESSRKHENIALKSTTAKQLNSLTRCGIRTNSIYPWVCLHYTFAVRNLILRCLTGSHMTMSSKSNYRVSLNVNMDIADWISIYFNFGKGDYFVIKVKQHIFGKARIFQMNRINPAIINWRGKKVETCARRLPPFEIFLGKTKYVR